MAILLSAPYSYFTDANGEPLAGGKVYTYDAGTSTPKDSYTDSTGATPASNPVTLDSAGKAAIWISGNYKLIVRDSSGTLIWTVDNVSATSASGDMTKAVYDAANILEQVLGLTAVQTVTNKTFTDCLANTQTVGNATTKLATTAFVDASNRFKVGSFTRDTATASGSQAVTGVGFTPKAILFLAVQVASKEMSVGVDDGTTAISVYQSSTAGTFNTTSYSIVGDENTGVASYIGKISTFDSDGFTITWTRTGTPTGTLTVGYIAIR